MTFTPPEWWLEAHPDEWVQYASGRVPSFKADSLDNALAASFASLAWRQDAGEYVRRLIREIEELPAGKRVLGYHFNYGVYSEWHSYGMYKDMPDVGTAMKRAFRRYLKETYQTDEALAAAWKQPDATLATALPPTAEARQKSSIVSLHDPVKERQVLDFECCNQKELDDAQSHFVDIVKSETQGRKLAGFYSGYLFGMGFPTCGWQINTPDKLAGKKVDFHVSPYCYDVRRLPGRAGLARAPIEAYATDGVLSIMEADTRPYQVKAGKPKGTDCCYSDNFQEDVALLTRDFCQSFIRGGGIWYYDFVRGWYDAPEYQELFRKFHQVQERTPDVSRVSQVAMVCDYKSMLYMNPAIGGSAIAAWLTSVQADELFGTGAAFDVITTEQVLNGKAREYKVYLFANLIRSNPAIMEKVQELRNNGKTIIWLYAPGYICEKNGASLSNIEKLTGFQVNMLARRLEQGYTITDGNLPVTKNLAQKECKSIVDGPVFYITDARAQAMGHWSLEGERRTVLAFRKIGDSLNFYSTSPLIERSLLQNIFRQAGVHIYHQSMEDVLFISKDLLCIHTATGGKKRFSLPAKAQKILQLLPEEKSIAEQTDAFEVNVPSPSTTLFQIVW